MKCEHARIKAIRQERIWNSYYKLYDNFSFVFGEILLCGNKKKSPLRSVQKDILEKMHQQKSSYFEGENVRSWHI
jgi:hypothetical protein